MLVLSEVSVQRGRKQKKLILAFAISAVENKVNPAVFTNTSLYSNSLWTTITKTTITLRV